MSSNNFWKLGLKVWRKILIATVLCFALTLFFGSGHTIMKVFLQIVELCIFGGLIYQFFWKEGSSDNNMVLMKKEKKNTWKGLFAGLIAIIPYFALYIIMLIAKTGIFYNEMAENVLLLIYYALNTPFTQFINSVLFSLHGDFADLSMRSVALSGINMIFIPLVSGIAYYMGYKQFSVFEHLTYKELNKKS